MVLAAKAVRAGQDLQMEAPEEILLQSLKVALVRHCVRLHARAGKAVPATSEMKQLIRLVVKVARFLITLATIQTKQVQEFYIY